MVKKAARRARTVDDERTVMGWKMLSQHMLISVQDIPWMANEVLKLQHLNGLNLVATLEKMHVQILTEHHDKITQDEALPLQCFVDIIEEARKGINAKTRWKKTRRCFVASAYLVWFVLCFGLHYILGMVPFDAGKTADISSILLISLVAPLNSLLMYTPQIALNIETRCDGMSLPLFFLDFLGGFGRVAQSLFLCIHNDTAEFITGNIPKFGVGVLTCVFLGIIICQYIYFHHWQKTTNNKKTVGPSGFLFNEKKPKCQTFIRGRSALDCAQVFPVETDATPSSGVATGATALSGVGTDASPSGVTDNSSSVLTASSGTSSSIINNSSGASSFDSSDCAASSSGYNA